MVPTPTITAEASCESALQIMRSARVDRVAVVEGDRVVGLVTDGDIYRLALNAMTECDGDESLLSFVNVGGVMTYAPPTVSPTTPLTEVAATMVQEGATTLLVVENGRLHGVLTTHDVLQGFLDAFREPDDTSKDK